MNMKNIISRLKKGFGLTETITAESTDVPVQKKPVSFIPATQVLRGAITSFIIESLQPYVDEKSLFVSGLHFYIACSDQQQEEAARAALFADRPGMYRTEHLERKLLDYFIQLEPGWFFEWHIVNDKLPAQCMQKGNFGLKVTGAGEYAHEQFTKAFIQVLAGQAEYSEYILDPRKQLRFNIGRSKAPQLFTGKIQQNDIVFLGKGDPGFSDLTGSPNLHVSRNHAYIVYDPKSGHYLLYPDRGGLPDNGNKLKVHTANDKMKWLNIYGVAHCLCDGDQVELGGVAVFRFQALGSI